MKLKTSIQYLLNHKLNKFVCLILIFLNLVSILTFAQEETNEFIDKSVAEVLNEIAHTFDINISFDSESLEKISISKKVKQDEVMTMLQSVLRGTGYEVMFLFNTYLVYKKPEDKPLQEVHKVKVVISDAETGERLPYSRYEFLKIKRSGYSGQDGVIVVDLKTDDHLFVQIRNMGYKHLDTMIIYAGDESIIDLRLRKKVEEIKAVNVTGERLQMVEIGDKAGHVVFNPGGFSDLPNYGETDVFRSLQLLPGISASENSSQLSVRGGSADQNLVMYDGFTLYNLDHFYGVFAALNSNVIKDIQVFKGGFESRYGERVSSIIDITGKSGNKKNAEFYGGVNLISGNLTAEIPISSKLRLVAAGRRAYSDLYSSWLAESLLAEKTGLFGSFNQDQVNTIEPEFYFQDYNVKLSYNPTENDMVSLTYYSANDKLTSGSEFTNKNTVISSEDENQWGNFGAGASWKRRWKKGSYSNLQMGYSGYFNDYQNITSFLRERTRPKLQDITRESLTREANNLDDYFITFRNSQPMLKDVTLQYGLSVRNNSFEFTKEGNENTIYSRLNNSSVLYSGYLQSTINISNRFEILPGIRLNYYAETGKVYPEPRLTLNFDAGKGFNIKAASGIYNQFINKVSTEQTYGYNRDFWVIAEGDKYPVVNSNHYILGSSFKHKSFYFDVEGYYKWTTGVQEYLLHNTGPTVDGSDASRSQLSRFVSGNSEVIGLDFLAKYEGRNFTSWLAYTLSKTTRQFDQINGGEAFPADWDRPHELKWSNVYKINSWNFSGLFLFGSGTPYIADTQKDDNFNTIRTYNRLPDYFRMDFSAGYNIRFKKINIKPGFSLLNALNTENYLDVYMRNLSVDGEVIREATLIKAQDITLNFYLLFRF